MPRLLPLRAGPSKSRSLKAAIRKRQDEKAAQAVAGGRRKRTRSKKKKVDEASVKKVLTAAGATVNEARIKSLVAALDGVNIDEAIKKQAVAAAPPIVDLH